MGNNKNKDIPLVALENLRMRLLDLTARNRLINFRHTRGASLRVIDELPDQLTETLLAEKEMRFLSVPEPTKQQLINAGYIEIDKETGQEQRLRKNPTAEEWARWLRLETSYEVPTLSSNLRQDKYSDKAIQTLLFPYELETRLRGLRQKANSSIDESGTNILYLAFGFLEWFENNDSDKSRIAPLFLIPTLLQKGRINPETGTYEYTLSYSGEDIFPNLSLREKLRRDFGLILPELDENTRPEEYFQSVFELVKANKPNWRLRRYITLALLNFSKLLMYLDLDPGRWPKGLLITDHPIAKYFLGSRDNNKDEATIETGIGFSEEYPIDEISDVHERYPLIEDADSSQHSALIEALDGNNLVIEGPPGTGKSQTITNLIAAAMAQGQKVLFVAEKLAALDVVKRRLDVAGLGDFCLELHSHKSKKRKVLDGVEARLNNKGRYRIPEDIDADIVRYEELKNALKIHVEMINQTWENTGKSLHEILVAATRYRRELGLNPRLLHPQGIDGRNFSTTHQRQIRDQVVAFRDAYKSVAQQLDKDSSLQSHPWFGVRNTNLQIFDADHVRDALEEWHNSIKELVNYRNNLQKELDCHEKNVPDNLPELSLLLEDFERLPYLKGDEILDNLSQFNEEVRSQVSNYLTLFQEIQSKYLELSEKLPPEVLNELSSIDQFSHSIDKLKQLVKNDVEHTVIAGTIPLIKELEDQLEHIREPVEEIIVAIGDKAGKHLDMHEQGIEELKVFIETVCSLKPEYLKLRSDLFDRDELDQTLSTVRSHIDNLHSLKNDLEGTYNLDILPDHSVLSELKTDILELNPGQWNLQNEIFEKGELDKTLQEMRYQFDSMQNLKSEIKVTYSLTELPNYSELSTLKSTILAGGTFRFFNKAWRNARKQLRRYSANPKTRFKKLIPLIDKAIIFTKNREDFEQNRSFLLGYQVTSLYSDIDSLDSVNAWFSQVCEGYRQWIKVHNQLLGYRGSANFKFRELYHLLDKAITFSRESDAFEKNSLFRELLGNHLDGLKTDINSLESVRTWYRLVRQRYGIGFGPKVALGSAIINMPIDIAKAIQSLAEQGMLGRIDYILGEIANLKKILMPISDIQCGTVSLVGDAGLLNRLKCDLDCALQDCAPLIGDARYTVAELEQYVKSCQALIEALAEWRKTDFDKMLFEKRLCLTPGVNIDNGVALASAYNTLEVAKCLKENINSRIITELTFQFPEAATFSKLHGLGRRLRELYNAQTEKALVFKELVQLDSSAWIERSGDKIDDLLNRNSFALTEEASLYNWLDYLRVRDHLSSMGFKALINSVEKGDLSAEQVEGGYLSGVYDMLSRDIFHLKPELGRFSGRSQETLQRLFTEYDEKIKIHQREKIAWAIDQTEVPPGYLGGRVSDYTEKALLEHECSKKKRHLPIRQLLKRAGNALATLKPCFMMGPMSVAQYLEPGQCSFDLIVMDEASQIKPEDALGAVARGTQLVVVGDPKQLPPTSFFDRILDDEEEDPTALEESESILDATLPIFSSRRLRWHYRSQHESLIAFSNHSFYNSDLVLFPSPHDDSKNYGVQYSRVHRGCFVNRRNSEEARVISEAVREHYLNHPNESLGVVAMSVEQREQIERSVEVLSKEDFSFRELLEKDQLNQESLFIKNLENVQGDERDVIFISLTYGPQEISGKVYQRFGPINSEVGWRRLNVLFTRSRKRMHVFSSMGSDDIVVSSNSKRGLKALRDFLSFCETGILHSTEKPTDRLPDSDFEVAVGNALSLEGFECVYQVGVTGFFIDIAVRDPGNPGRYLMGVECDGATYHSAKSARDRDRLRQAILERLGWRIRRIWSTDWFKNPEAELKPIIRELHDLKTERPLEASMVSESDEIEEIIKDIENREASVDSYIAEEISLKDKLLAFDREVMRNEIPDIPENKRLLRPAMLDALLEHLPTDKSEFLEFIPFYLRESTATGQGKYLDNVLELINSEHERMS